MYDYDREEDQPAAYGPEDDFCEHGTYVGGCGIDWMCGDCEAGISAAERRAIGAYDRLSKIRKQASQAERLLDALLRMPECGGIMAAEMTERASNVNNPAARYGRTGWR